MTVRACGDIGPCDVCGLPAPGYQAGEVFVWPDGGCTPKPVELILREEQEIAEAHALRSPRAR